MLLDSIYRGLPIGALTLWITSKKNFLYLRTEPKVLPPFNHSNGKVSFLLDGQQRLSVLFGLFEGLHITNSAHKDVDFDRLCFRVTENTDDGRFQYRKAVTNVWVPIRGILARDWERHLQSLTTGQINRVRDFRKKLLDYRIPVLSLETESIEDARELFIRINAAGTPISSADKAFARAARFDLRELADQAWKDLPDGFKVMKDESILQTRALLDNIGEVGNEAMERAIDYWEEQVADDLTVRALLHKKWQEQKKATLRAIDLLRTEFHVLDHSILPSHNMVSLLTVFFALRPKTPSKPQLQAIRKWFWFAALGSRYSGRGHRQNILQDVKFFRNLALDKTTNFKVEELLDPSVLWKASYLGRSSVADALFCLLIAQEPIHLKNGSKMQMDSIASAANHQHRHHIFPKKFLQGKRVGKVPMNSALNLCLMTAEDNSEFGYKPPIKYLQIYRDMGHFERTMKRHLIPASVESALWGTDAKSYLRFLKERESLLVQALEKKAGCRLFKRS